MHKQIEQIIELVLSFLKSNIYNKVQELQFQAAHHEPVDWEEIITPYSMHEPETHVYFRTEYQCSFDSMQRLFLLFDIEGEANLYINQQHAYGIDYQHREYLLDTRVVSNRRYHIQLDLFTGRWIPSAESSFRPFSKNKVILSHRYLKDRYPIFLNNATVCIENAEVKDLYYDVRTLLEIAGVLDSHSLRKHDLLYRLYAILSQIDLVDLQDRALRARFIQQVEACRADIAPLLEKTNSATTPTVHFVGHAHIDYAWLWTKEEAIFKMGKTYSTVLKLMEQYPELTFIQSQSYYTELVQGRFPELMERIGQAYRTGQWESEGGVFVEMDCNIPSGESLVRQMLYGITLAQSHFPNDHTILWLPDCFGFPHSLPQLMIGFGLKYLVTGKLIWNDTHPFPYDAFQWKGMDGSEVKVHIFTGKMFGFNGKASVPCVQEAWNNVRHKALQPEILFTVGMGDGGGGPTLEDMELARRIRDVEGSPRTRWTKAGTALRHIFEGSDLPGYHGGLYFERHRGTYTTQASLKRRNRKLEFLLREAELALCSSCMLHPVHQDDWQERSSRIEAMWKVLLANQFHDIIAGVCIASVYDEVYAQLDKLQRDVAQFLLQEYARIILIHPDAARNIWIVNTYPWDWEGLVCIPADHAALIPIDSPQVQRCEDLEGRQVMYLRHQVPPLAISRWSPGEVEEVPTSPPFTMEGNRLDTPFYRVEFDHSGDIRSLLDVENAQEYVGAGCAFNSFALYEDVPLMHDAWDVDKRFLDKPLPLVRGNSVSIMSVGNLFIQLRRELVIGHNSRVVQDVFFYTHSKRVDFQTVIHWHESHKLLKVHFPLNLQAESADFEVQFGYSTYPVRRNNPSDSGKFEVPVHKWMRIHDESLGAAIMNDSKYGAGFDESGLSLTLLRSPKAPDASADMGEHRCTYAFLPEQDVVKISREAHRLNNPPPVLQQLGSRLALTLGVIGEIAAADLEHSLLEDGETSSNVDLCPFFEMGPSDIMLETVKPCAASESGMILRLANPYRKASRLEFRCKAGVRDIVETNLAETETIRHLNKDAGIMLNFRPFEVKTLKIMM